MGKDFLNGTWVQTKAVNMDKVSVLPSISLLISDSAKNGLQLARSKNCRCHDSDPCC